MTRLAAPKAHVSGNLVVAASGGMQPSACVADRLGQCGFDVHVNVLFVGVPLEVARLDCRPDRFQAGLDLITPLDPHLSGGVCVIRVPPAKSNEIYSKLYDDHGIAGASTGGLRLCPHIYNTRDHIDRAIRGVKALLAKA